MYAAGGAIAHCDCAAWFAIAALGAAYPMLAAADARHSGGGKKGRWRSFLPIEAALTNVGFALF
jgi:hypothetical protein